MELIFLGINLLLFMAVWHFMLRPSILDMSRDRLFDLRTHLRQVFVEHKWDLASPAYRRLRDLVNGHLRFTEELSLARTSYVRVQIKKSNELQAFLHDKINKTFHSPNPEQLKFIRHFRQQSLKVVTDYAILGSGWLLILALCILPIVLAQMFLAMLRRGVDWTAAVCTQKLLNMGKYVSLCMSVSTDKVAKVWMLPDWIESNSFNRGLAT
jgi:hypothetical protein